MDLTTLLHHVDDLGAAFGILGAWLVGSRTSLGRWWGFWGFFISNVCLIAWAIAEHHTAILVMQAFFVITSLRGLWTNRPGSSA